MFPLFESIRIENRQFHNLDLHQDRVNRAFSKKFPNHLPLNLKALIRGIKIDNGKFKCRISYNQQSNKLDIKPYEKKPPSSLKVIVSDTIEYDLKYEDRKELNQLYELKADKDDILIVRNGFITDTSYGNICLLKDGDWFTPLHPLLLGTQRAYILKEKIAFESAITLDKLFTYEKFMVVNAMLPFDISRAQPIDFIFR